MLTPEQLTQAISEVQTSIPKSIEEHLGTFGVMPDECMELGTAAGTIIGALYQMEFGGEDATETETEQPTADNTPNGSDIPKSYVLSKVGKNWTFTKSVTKAGATWSAANKAKIKEVYGKVKEMHDEAHATKEDSAPASETKQAETKSVEEIDFQTAINKGFIKLQGF